MDLNSGGRNNLNSKELTELKVFKKSEHCGYLRRRLDGGVEFIFDSAYIANPNTKDLCFNIKKKPEPYIQHGVNLPPYFAGLLPEGLRLKYLLQKVKTSPDDLFSLFAALGSDCVGDVYTRQNNDGQNEIEAQKLPSWKDVNFYNYFLASLSDQTIKDTSDFAGVQEKISASMISLPFNLKNKGSYILKLNPKDKLNLVYNEWACLYLAQLCDIEVNEFQLIEDKDLDLGLLVTRFDRIFQEGKWIRIHQEDMCQILNIFPSEKYRVPLREIYSALTKFTTAPLIEIYKLTKLIVFSYLIGNGDLHAKNISLYESPTDGRVRLTPAYDLICTLLYGDQKMALKLDAKDSNIKRIDVINFVQRFGLSKIAIENLIDNLLKDFYNHHHILFSIPMPENKMTFLANELSHRIQSLS
jgi:serine/threonine-protein kinase HipA